MTHVLFAVFLWGLARLAFGRTSRAAVGSRESGQNGDLREPIRPYDRRLHSGTLVDPRADPTRTRLRRRP